LPKRVCVRIPSLRSRQAFQLERQRGREDPRHTSDWQRSRQSRGGFGGAGGSTTGGSAMAVAPRSSGGEAAGGRGLAETTTGGSRRCPGRSWRCSAARCSILPKPSTDLGLNQTHVLVPATPHEGVCPCGLPSRARASSGPTARSATRDAVERKARGGHATNRFSQNVTRVCATNRPSHASTLFPKN
jgi:hypothetical protein